MNEPNSAAQLLVPARSKWLTLMAVFNWLVPLAIVPCLFVSVRYQPRFESAAPGLVIYSVLLVGCCAFAIATFYRRQVIYGAIVNGVLALVFSAGSFAILLLTGVGLYMLPQVQAAIEEEQQRQRNEKLSGGIPTAVPDYEPPPMEAPITLEVADVAFPSEPTEEFRWYRDEPVQSEQVGPATMTRLYIPRQNSDWKNFLPGRHGREVFMVNELRINIVRAQVWNLEEQTYQSFGPEDVRSIAWCSEGLVVLQRDGTLTLIDPDDRSRGKAMSIPSEHRHTYAGSYPTGEDRYEPYFIVGSRASSQVLVMSARPDAMWLFDIATAQLVAQMTKQRMQATIMAKPQWRGRDVAWELLPLPDGKSFLDHGAGHLVRWERQGNGFAPVEFEGPRADPLGARDTFRVACVLETGDGWRVPVTRVRRIDSERAVYVVELVDPFNLAAGRAPLAECNDLAPVTRPRDCGPRERLFLFDSSREPREQVLHRFDGPNLAHTEIPLPNYSPISPWLILLANGDLLLMRRNGTYLLEWNE